MEKRKVIIKPLHECPYCHKTDLDAALIKKCLESHILPIEIADYKFTDKPNFSRKEPPTTITIKFDNGEIRYYSLKS